MRRLHHNPRPKLQMLLNGLRVIATPMPHARSLSLALAVQAGSIYDPPHAAGLAHFLEHLIFKSTDEFSRHELASAMQRCGNRFDPSTNKELISISGTVPVHKYNDALALVGSVAQRPRFDADDVEVERQVVLEELRDWEEDPSKRIEVLTDATLWGPHPLGRDTGGTRATVRDITRAQVRGYHRRYFHPRNAVLSLAGPLSCREMMAAARRHFGRWRAVASSAMPRRPATMASAPAIRQSRRSKVLRRANTHQVWFSVSTTTPSYPQGYDGVLRTQLAQVLIGDGDGSRLWDGLRERLGLAYEVYATLDFYQDVGVMSAMAAVGRGRAGAAVREMQRILEETEEGFTRDEFARGRDALAAQIDLAADWNAAHASRYAELALFNQPLVTPAEELAKLADIRPGEFNRFVREKIRWNHPTVCAIGQGSALDIVRGD
ncbi:MAG: insulinase family protein [Candidatus Eremiobacteraeota bacterium]|nr:insulinase family protein [Candidatus Eremiobacteraeota bacterium]